MFTIFLQLGFEHITDFYGYDHILFLVVLSISYTIKQWKRLLVLITAFTAGHTISLALAVSNIIYVNSSIIEFLIPVTILFTAILNLVKKQSEANLPNHYKKYLIAIVFGLIHGLGFSGYLKSILNAQDSIFTPLLAFNIGLEIGQIVIVFILYLISNLINKLFPSLTTKYVVLTSGLIGIVALFMIINRFQSFLI